MKKAHRIAIIVTGIVVVVCFIGSFPVRHYYGEEYCDLIRIIGLAFLVAYLILDALAKKKNSI